VQAVWPAIIYGGVFSVAGGFTLQAVGQSKAPASDAALILSLEAVFAAVFGALLLAERMDTVQIIGSVIIMAAILVAQLVTIRSEPQPEQT
jgi:drug/metabolite transporter (DMT)-like permease